MLLDLALPSGWHWAAVTLLFIGPFLLNSLLIWIFLISHSVHSFLWENWIISSYSKIHFIWPKCVRKNHLKTVKREITSLHAKYALLVKFRYNAWKCILTHVNTIQQLPFSSGLEVFFLEFWGCTICQAFQVYALRQSCIRLPLCFNVYAKDTVH